MIEFAAFPKIARLSRLCTITEKIDGTNASIYIGEDGTFLTGSRNRWITPEDDNHGFSKWAHLNKEELLKLGPGHHFGEWWGRGVQRGYGLSEKRFSLFNATRWADERPSCCSVVPKIIPDGVFDTEAIKWALEHLQRFGSRASPGFMRPEGVVIYHHASNTLFKKTLEKDEEPKGHGKA